jgi:predicted kinase
VEETLRGPDPDPKPVLIVTVGAPCSGKSTWARSTGYPVVNPDAIRLAVHGQRFSGEAEPLVWCFAQYMVRALFLAGHRYVVLDATNTTRSRRSQWKSKHWDVQYRLFDTPKEECIRRALIVNDTEIVPVIERMFGVYEPLDPDDERYEP